MCLLSLLIRRRFIFRPLESSGAGFWEVWFMSAYLIIIKFNISYFKFLGFVRTTGSNKRIPIFLVPNSTDLKNCSEFCRTFKYWYVPRYHGGRGVLSVRKNIPYVLFGNILYAQMSVRNIIPYAQGNQNSKILPCAQNNTRFWKNYSVRT